MKSRSAVVRAISLLAVQGTLLTTACDDSDHVIDVPELVVHGNGNVVEETRPVGSFDRLAHEGVGNVYIHQGAREELVVRAESNLLEHLKTEVHGGELLIWKDHATLFNTHAIEYHLTVVELERLELSGAGGIRAEDLQVGSLALKTTGVGSVECLNLSATRLEVDGSGVGELILSGAVQEQTVSLSGTGDYDGRDLASVEADVFVTFGRSATVRVSDRLKATVRLGGSVYYIGDPVVETDIGGGGEVTRIPG